jgi:hypothetical protein
MEVLCASCKFIHRLYMYSFCANILVLLQGAVKVMAKDLIRTRHQITKFYQLKSQLQGVSLRVQVTMCLVLS